MAVETAMLTRSVRSRCLPSGVGAALLVLVATLPGCGLNPMARRATVSVLMVDQAERIAARLAPTRPTAEVLEAEGLSLESRLHPERTLVTLAERNRDDPEAGRTLAIAELAYRTARGKPRLAREEAGRLYREAASYARLALCDPEIPPLDEAGSARAIELHNEAVEQLIRLTWLENISPGADWRELYHRLGVAVRCRSDYLPPDRVEGITIAADYRVFDMQTCYRSEGLGVPLVVHKRIPPGQHRPDEQFYPGQDWAAASAVLHVEGRLRDDSWRRLRPVLDLHDPFEESHVVGVGQALPLASDRTAPLALHNGRVDFNALAREGLLHSSFEDDAREGIVMLQPYRSGKIPVLLVHGLNSSPATWVQTYNHLRNDPVLGRRFQFWLYMYPTGRPVLASAARLRAEIRRVRQTYDPGRADPAWDRMVVIGHSMGGLLTKLLIQQSGSRLWDGMFTRPYPEVEMPPDVRHALNEGLFFDRVPEVRRVVFIATPHRGSRVADRLPGRLAMDLIRPTPELEQATETLRDLNGPGLLQPDFRKLILSSVGNLQYDNPTLRLIASLPIDPSISVHSIILQIGNYAARLPTDGVVPTESARIDWGRSEVIVPGFHGDHKKLEVTAELRRILLEHLEELESASMRTASSR